MLDRSKSSCSPACASGNAIEELVGAGARAEWDLVFSNAALQWVPDHERVFPAIFLLVRPGGQLVVQMPSNYTHPTHTFIDELAQEEPFRSALRGYRRSWLAHGIDSTRRCSTTAALDIVVFEGYPHVLPDADALADWTSGTALVPFMERLPDDLRGPFMERYRARLRERFRSAGLLRLPTDLMRRAGRVVRQS
jgi:trans-aconitate 2-methyltransferase